MTIAAAQSIKAPDRFFIGGEWVAPSTTDTIDVITPSSEEVLITVAEAQEADVARAVDAARSAFDHGPWPRMSHAERAGYLRAIGAAIEKHVDPLADLWTGEMGITRAASGMIAGRGGNTYNFYAGLADTFPFIEHHKPMIGNHGLLIREPVGVVGAIVPWNGPMTMIGWKIAPALLAGCTIILKLSPEAPTTGLLIAQICEEIGLPKGVLNVLTADRGASEGLVRHPGVDKITFTGSSAAGKRIGAICGERVARCTLELGGKSAGIVFDDYDLATAARSISQSARGMSGQVCSSLTRIVVSRHRHDELLEAMAESFGAIRVGDPFSVDSDMGPVATSRQRDRVEGYIGKGVAEGATLATGGHRPAHLNRGFYVEPTVFGNVTNDMAIGREEIFGPVVSVIPADDEAQAVKIANASVFGLNASVFTNDVERAYRAARELRSGTVGHNHWRTDFSIAFGGFKESGIGREGGTEGLLPFLETKTVILDSLPAKLTA